MNSVANAWKTLESNSIIDVKMRLQNGQSLLVDKIIALLAIKQTKHFAEDMTIFVFFFIHQRLMVAYVHLYLTYGQSKLYSRLSIVTQAPISYFIPFSIHEKLQSRCDLYKNFVHPYARYDCDFCYSEHFF